MHSQRRRRRSVPAVVATALVAGLLATPLTVSEAATGNPALRCLDASASLATIGDRDFCLVAFTSAGTFNWTVPEGVESLDVLAVGSGGGGGGGATGGGTVVGAPQSGGGGGGAGGNYFTAFVTEALKDRIAEGKNLTIVIEVGAGGQGGAGAVDASSPGSDGSPGTFTTARWIDDNVGFNSITSVAGGGGGKGGTIGPVTDATSDPANTAALAGGAGGTGADPRAAGGGGGKASSEGVNGGAGATTAFQSFWQAEAPGERTISGGGGGGDSCGGSFYGAGQGGGSGGRGASSRALDGSFVLAVSGTLGGGGGGGAGSGGGGCDGASTAGADGGDGAFFLRYEAFPTSATSNPFDIIIIVAAKDLEPRTISVDGIDALDGGVPTFTVARDGKYTFDIPAEGVTTTVLEGTLGSAAVGIAQDRGEESSRPLRLYWTNPAGQEVARIEVERIAIDDEDDPSCTGDPFFDDPIVCGSGGDSNKFEDLDPFSLTITTGQFGFSEATAFSGRASGPRTIRTGLPVDGPNLCAEPDLGGSCELQARLQFAPDKGVGDLGEERTITSRFVFTILDN